MARLRTLLASKSGACVCPKDMPSPEQKDRRVNSRERVVLLPVLTHTLDSGTLEGRLGGGLRRRAGCLQGMPGSDNHAGLLAGRQSGASRICCIGRQITEARPVQDPPAKGGGRQKFDLSRGEQIYQCLVNAAGDRPRLHLAAECTNLDRPGAAVCRY